MQGWGWLASSRLLTLAVERDSELHMQAMQLRRLSTNLHLPLEEGCSQGHDLPAPLDGAGPRWRATGGEPQVLLQEAVDVRERGKSRGDTGRRRVCLLQPPAALWVLLYSGSSKAQGGEAKGLGSHREPVGAPGQSWPPCRLCTARL